MAKTKEYTPDVVAPVKRFTVKNQVTVPTISFKNRTALAFKCLNEIRVGKQMPATKNKDGTETLPKPADLMRIVELESGNTLDLILNTVLKETLEEYGDYVGKCFIAESTEVPGKKYKGFNVSEIEDPTT